MRSLVWFRGKDLRIADHAPLRDAALGDAIPVFVLDPFFFEPARARMHPHRIQFLLDSLRDLEQRIAALGSRLLIATGRSTEVVPALARRLRVDRVVAHRWVEPFARERDRRVAAALAVPFDLYEGETLAAPGTLRTAAGQPFAVFSQFARAFAKHVVVDPPLPPLERLRPIPPGVAVDTVAIPTCESLGIVRNPRVLAGGESAARRRLAAFLAGPGRDYDRLRDRLDLDGTSRLSADLKFGTLSVRAAWAEAGAAALSPKASLAFRNELLWREFAHSTLWDRPDLLTTPFRPEFAGFPWRVDEDAWVRWVEGRTGYPVVDAAARQLLAEGYVHNRARMIAASFLTKHLLIDYKLGEAHYLRYLTDGDWAQNNAGWQWSAGCGCDAQPYFRVFNPMLQGARFDPEGGYVRRYVPELASMPAAFIHRPWEAPPRVLDEAGVRLGQTYPLPIVDHREARARFLALTREHLSHRRR